MISEYMICNQKLIQKLSAFVADTCKERDPSHGWKHMKDVAEMVLVIISQISNFTEDNIKLALICAWLHDVNDHKYGNENENKLNVFLENNFSSDKDKIISIIERVSFSREKKNGRSDWLDVLYEDGVKIRNVVSDADKIYALDIDRCFDYEKNKFPNLSDKDIWARVINHCNEKLLLLKDQYIITDIAKKIAEPINIKMIARITELKKQFNI